MLLSNIDGLTDSKLLSSAKRQHLAGLIKQNSVWGIGWVEPIEIDERGLTKAVRLAMQRAIGQIKCDFDEIIIDGNYNFLKDDNRVRTLVRADRLIPAVSAASIIAKVARDDLMLQMDLLYPGYNFATNVGYGTSRHIAGLHKLGICELHRKSYLPVKNFMC